MTKKNTYKALPASDTGETSAAHQKKAELKAIQKIQTAILDYLQGRATVTITREKLDGVCNPPQTLKRAISKSLVPSHYPKKQSCKTLLKKIKINKAAPDEYTIAILRSLGISDKTNLTHSPSEYTKLLESKNLYELLIDLARDGHHHVDRLIKIIDTIKPTNYILKITSSIGALALTVATGLLLLFKAAYQRSAELFFKYRIPLWFNGTVRTFAVMKNLPIIGITVSALSLLVSWYKGLRNGSTKLAHKISKLFLTTLSTGMAIGGYVISYYSAGRFPLVAGILFVFSSIIEVYNVFKGFRESKLALKQVSATCGLPSEDEVDTRNWEQMAAYQRARNFHQRAKVSMWIEGTSGLISTVLVGIWCFAPASLGIELVIFCVICLTLTAFAKDLIIRSIHDKYADILQAEIADIPKELLRDELAPQIKADLSSYERMSFGSPARNPQPSPENDLSSEALAVKLFPPLEKSALSVETSSRSASLGTYSDGEPS